jgi:hypothetical protein
MTMTMTMTSSSKICFLCEDEEVYDDGEFDDVWFGEVVGEVVVEVVGEVVGGNCIVITLVAVKKSELVIVVISLESWT